MNEFMSFLKKFRSKQIDKKRSFIVGLVLIFAVTTIYLIIDIKKVSQSEVTQQLIKIPEVIEGKIVTLKQLKEEYFIDYHNMFSNIVRKNLEFPEHITLSYTINYLREEMRKSHEGIMLAYCIFDNKDRKLIGYIDIRDLNDDDPGQLGCWINELYWGGGRFQEALDLTSKTYFANKPAEKQYIAHVRLWNTRSYYGLKKYGFKEIGFYYEDNQPTRYILELKREQVIK
jgi:RimJ/RimL family protein N-acetyltransferase